MDASVKHVRTDVLLEGLSYCADLITVQSADQSLKQRNGYTTFELDRVAAPRQRHTVLIIIFATSPTVIVSGKTWSD